MTYRRRSAPAGWFPRRGEICRAALDKERPVLIVSSNALNRHSLDVCIVPVSTVEHRAFSLRPKLRAGEGGLARDSWAKCDQVTTLEKSAICYPPLGVVGPESLGRVELAIKQALELP
jgi:mRNA interferase MazF